MINNDPSKSTRSIARKMTTWRHLVFLIQDKKNLIFLTSYEGQKEKQYCKHFEQTQAFPPINHALVFLRWEKILLRSDDELNE